MFNQYLLLIIPVVGIVSCIGYVAFQIWKLQEFRRNIRPGDVVKYKMQDEVAFKVVVTRPSREIVFLKHYDDDDDVDHCIPFRALINKIYPL